MLVAKVDSQVASSEEIQRDLMPSQANVQLFRCHRVLAASTVMRERRSPKRRLQESYRAGLLSKTTLDCCGKESDETRVGNSPG